MLTIFSVRVSLAEPGGAFRAVHLSSGQAGMDPTFGCQELRKAAYAQLK